MGGRTWDQPGGMGPVGLRVAWRDRRHSTDAGESPNRSAIRPPPLHEHTAGFDPGAEYEMKRLGRQVLAGLREPGD